MGQISTRTISREQFGGAIPTCVDKIGPLGRIADDINRPDILVGTMLLSSNELDAALTDFPKLECTYSISYPLVCNVNCRGMLFTGE